MTASNDPKVQLGARVSRSIRDASKAAAVADGRSLNVWVERALAAALEGSHGSVQRPATSAPQRAPVIRTASEVAAEITRESARDRKARAAAEREIDQRQAKLNAAKYGGQR